MRTITLTIADDVSDADALAAVVKMGMHPKTIPEGWNVNRIMDFVGGITVEAIADAQGDAFLVQKGVR